MPNENPQHNHNQQRIGKSMLGVFWVLFLIALVIIFGNWERKQHNPNQSPDSYDKNGTRSVTLKRNAFGHYVTSGWVNGKESVFMLDTGATTVAVPAETAKKLQLRYGPSFTVQTANGLAAAYRSNIEHLKIGTIELHNVAAAITPGMTGNEILLGMSALKHIDFAQSGQQLTLTQHKP